MEIELHIHTAQRQSYLHTFGYKEVGLLAWAEKIKEEASCPRDATGMDSMFRIIHPSIMHLENYNITNIPLTS
jgi:hypothetical protein